MENKVYCKCKNKGKNLILIVEDKQVCSKCLKLWDEEEYLKELKGGLK